MEHPKFQYSKILKEIAVLVLTISNSLSRGQDQPPPRVGFDPARIAPRVAPGIIPRLATEPTERVILDTPPIPDSPPTPPSRATTRPTPPKRGEVGRVMLPDSTPLVAPERREETRRAILSWIGRSDPRRGTILVAFRDPRSCDVSPHRMRCDSAAHCILRFRTCGGVSQTISDEFILYMRNGTVVDSIQAGPNHMYLWRQLDSLYPGDPDWMPFEQRRALGLKRFLDAYGNFPGQFGEVPFGNPGC